MMVSNTLLLLLVAVGVASQPYVNEVYFVVEPSVLDKYINNFGYDKTTGLETLKGDLDYTIYQINQMYSGLKHYGLDMEIRAKKVEILSKSIFGDMGQDKTLHTDDSLKAFKEWLKKNDAASKIGYDLAFVWTGHDIIGSSGSSGVAGYAYVKGTCDPNGNLAIGEFSGVHGDAIIAAHEIGHSLGAQHDDTCSKNGNGGGYIMNAVTDITSTNRWDFSYCSYLNFFTYITSLNSKKTNCMVPSKTTTKATTFDMASQLGRDTLDVDKTCQRNFEKTSFFYNGPELHKDGSTMCHYIGCAKPDTDSIQYTNPAEGIVCDVGKRCNRGKCVAAPSNFPTPKNLNKDCLYGDNAKINTNEYGPLKCSSYLDKAGPGRCYDDGVRAKCCSSCAKVKTNVKDCPYGDKSNINSYEYGTLTCSSYLQKAGTGRCYGIREICCSSCAKVKTNVKGCEYGDRYSNCQSLTKHSGQCYSQNTLNGCCESCKKVKSETKGCEYGDRNSFCSTYNPQTLCRVETNRKACCLTCSNYIGKRSLGHILQPFFNLTKDTEEMPSRHAGIDELQLDEAMDEPIAMV